MFTGIVQGTGRVTRVSGSGDGSSMGITVSLGRHARGLKKGQSVALDGVCLTALKISGGACSFEMIGETARLTTLGSLERGGTVNVERSMRAGDRIEGHFVMGHVDGTARITKMQRLPDEVRMSFRLPKTLTKYVAKKGSIALDGISLTVTGVRGSTATVSLIPHTLEVTGLGAKGPGDRLNVEVDALARYVAKLPKSR